MNVSKQEAYFKSFMRLVYNMPLPAPLLCIPIQIRFARPAAPELDETGPGPRTAGAGPPGIFP